MSQTIRLNTGNHAIIETDIRKIFVWNPRYERSEYTNGTGSEVTMSLGTIIARRNSDAKVLPFESNAVAGSRNIVGVLAREETVADGETVELVYCVQGDVDQGGLIFTRSGDTVDTEVDGELVKDTLRKVGIKLVQSQDLTNFDNA